MSEQGWEDVGTTNSSGGWEDVKPSMIDKATNAVKSAAGWATEKSKPSKTPWQDIASAGIGAGTMMTVAGAALTATGVGAEIGVPMVLGAGLSGAISEGAGQFADAMHLQNWASQGVRLAAGTIGSAATSLIEKGFGWIGKKLVQSMPGGKLISSMATNDETTISQKVEAAVNSAKEQAGGQRSMAEAHQVVKQQLDHEMQIAQNNAKVLVDHAEAEAAKIEAQSPQAAAKIRENARKAADELLAHADAIHKEAVARQQSAMKKANQIKTEQAGSLEKVGTRTVGGRPATVSDEGQIMQDAANKQHEKLTSELRKLDKQNRDAKNAVVEAKESEGVYPKDTKAFKSFYKYLKDRFESGAVTHPTAVGQIDMLKNALNGNRVPTQFAKKGDMITNAQGVQVPARGGEPTEWMTVNSREEAIDYLRRKYGDAAFGGKDVEGFSALNQKENAKIYNFLSEIQKEYIGEDVWNKLQSDYAKGKSAIDKKFGSGSADKAIDINKKTDELSANPASLSKEVFSTKASVTNMVNASGVEPVVKAAGMKIAREIEGMDSKGVQKYLKDNADWIQGVGKYDKTLQSRLEEYAAGLKKAETRTQKLQQASEGVVAKATREKSMLEKEAAGIRETSPKESTEKVSALQDEANEIRKKSRAAGDAITEAAGKKASKILTSDSPVESITKMINDDPSARLVELAGVMKDSPKGKEVLARGLHAALLNKHPSQIKSFWQDKLGPAVHESGIMTPAQVKTIEKQIAEIERAYGKTSKANTMMRDVLLKAMVGYAASAQAQVRGDTMQSLAQKKSAEQRAKEAMQ